MNPAPTQPDPADADLIAVKLARRAGVRQCVERLRDEAEDCGPECCQGECMSPDYDPVLDGECSCDCDYCHCCMPSIGGACDDCRRGVHRL